jgi:hypothetical protein
MSKKIGTLFALMALAGAATGARADEELIPIAVNGSWGAAAHHTSETAPPDVCIAMSHDGLGFRSSDDGLEIRMTKSEWSLPANVSGQIVLIIGADRSPFTVAANTSTMVDAVLPPDQAPGLLDKIAAAPSMTVQVGSAKPISIALDGSKVVLAAFRTCSGIGGGNGGGENPFAK